MLFIKNILLIMNKHSVCKKAVLISYGYIVHSSCGMGVPHREQSFWSDIPHSCIFARRTYPGPAWKKTTYRTKRIYAQHHFYVAWVWWQLYTSPSKIIFSCSCQPLRRRTVCRPTLYLCARKAANVREQPPEILQHAAYAMHGLLQIYAMRQILAG